MGNEQSQDIAAIRRTNFIDGASIVLPLTLGIANGKLFGVNAMTLMIPAILADMDPLKKTFFLAGNVIGLLARIQELY